ncbi:MAG: DNA gyrase subunit A [Anaerolineae bacterium]|jgi:DNA gyrase subunit A|nr:DNA gyrase subunit A [Anaerolineae bacterium]MBT7071086.1 DNA gyrase subunit A [Anaerolineae bacterium]MBT7324052.1 DNA gyrase subunit A [Anaerolineae bacterium]
MEAGEIKQVDINHEMRSAYLDYAMSVIVARALPDSRDGLKPVHRRILYAMHDMGIRATGSHKKSARIVGEVLGKYHPHGDSAVYESMARMAQDFSLRYPLVDGQGNFGSIDGDSPAAMRYTEARMGKLAEEMLIDIDKETVDFTLNFDDSLEEPSVLPSRLPNLLLNGSSGIAVGMATNIPPHNLRELSSALIYMIDNYDVVDEIGVDKLMEFVSGPDFPTGGIIVGREGIVQAYSTGKGRVIMRGMAHIEELRAGRYKIVVTEIPYQINKTSLIERIAELARSGKIDSISDLRDESDRTGMSIVIELKRGSQPKKVLNQLYKYTTLQSTFGVQMLALVDNEPKLLSLKRSLQIFIEHRREIITRRTTFELKKARARAHILDGLLIALDNIDAVIETIRSSDDVDAARQNLMKRFKLSELQAQAILDMQLRRLAALERWKIEEEHKEIMARIAYYEDLLAHPKKVLALIKDDLIELLEKYGDERRTRIAANASGDLNEEDLVEDESVLVSITERGYVKRVVAQTFRTQGRGGRGVKGHSTRDEDEIMMMIPARTLDTILFFSDKGKVYSEKTYQIPEASRTGKGIPIVNILALEGDERVTAAISVRSFDDASYCTLATLNGRIKRVELSEFSSVRPSGLIAMGLNGHDKLGWARLTSGDNDLILVTEQGKALRYSEKAVRSMGRPAAGVIGIRLAKDDKMTTMDVIEPNSSLLIVTKNGVGKQTPLSEYSSKGRGTQGILTIDKHAIPVVGKIIAARVVQQEDHLTLMSTGGVIIRLKVSEVKTAGRATRGVHLMRTQEGDTVAAVARIAAEDLKQVGADINEESDVPEDGQQELL